MTLATAWSNVPDSAAAFGAAYGRLCERLAAPPDLLVLHYGEGHDPAVLSALLAGLPASVRPIGGSSSHGVMTEEGVFPGASALGLLGLRSAGSRFGVGFRDKRDDPRAAATEAVLAALDEAGRPGELPDLVILSGTPNGEEEALSGIADVLGDKVPVFGGTAGDNGSTGRWSVLSRHGHGADSLAVAVVFADFPMSRAFQGGCVPSRFSGTVTETDGPRVIRRIDGQPAAEVYAAWYEMQAGQALPRDAGALLRQTALIPLGREVGNVGGFGAFSLSHIWTARADGGLEVLTDIAAGQTVRLMVGERRTLVARPARTVDSAIAMQCADVCTVTGGLIAFCAGLVLTLGDDLREVQQTLRVAMLGRPFLAAFSFGEQGCLLEDRAIHGNLMISVLILGR